MGIAFDSLVSILGRHAAEHPDDRAYVFLGDHGGEKAVLTFAELDRRASALASYLAARAEPGMRALLVFPPGLDFIIAFFACLTAGIIAVPMAPPRRHRLRDSGMSIVNDCAPTLGLTVRELLELVGTIHHESSANSIEWIGIDGLEQPSVAYTVGDYAEPDPQTIAFLQYTSGSTSAPKGVIVSHGNLLANLEMMRLANNHERHTTRVGWIPLYHDMGLILNALHATFVGALSVLMAPAAFMQRPLSWLRAIHDYRAELTCAPNFAFDLCVDQYRSEQMEGIDLSCWKVAINGAEPVSADTLERFTKTFNRHGFHRAAMHPNYGMAEATLMVSGGQHDTGPALWPVTRDGLKINRLVPPNREEVVQTLVGCGRTLIGERIAIVEPVTCRKLSAGQVGEIWVSGPNVTLGYWQKPDATQQTFRAQVVGEADTFWLRTGDLGCLDEAGELYVTGRIKDMIIVRGANHYPQDIERTAEKSHPALRPHCGAAFIAARHGQELLVVVHEIERTSVRRANRTEIVGAIRSSVVQEHELTLHEVVLVRPGSIPKTSSGKIRRSLTRELWLNDELDTWDETNEVGSVRVVRSVDPVKARGGNDHRELRHDS